MGLVIVLFFLFNVLLFLLFGVGLLYLIIRKEKLTLLQAKIITILNYFIIFLFPFLILFDDIKGLILDWRQAGEFVMAFVIYCYFPIYVILFGIIIQLIWLFFKILKHKKQQDKINIQYVKSLRFYRNHLLLLPVTYIVFTIFWMLLTAFIRDLLIYYIW